MKRLLFLIIFGVVGITIIGCGGEVNLDEPPEIVYGQDVCDACGMLINDPRFAAAYVTETEEVRLFDDIGGMFAHDSNFDEAVFAYWVHDLNTQEWTRAERATFVLMENGAATPMGWGIAAFKVPADAEAFAAENGGLLLTFSELQTEMFDEGIDPTQLHDHFHDKEESHSGQSGQDGHDSRGSHGRDS